MINQITNYKELLQEKARLKALLAGQEQQIKEDWHSIKEDLKPAVLIGSTLRKLVTRKTGASIAQLGVNLLTDGFVKKVLLGKTGWLTRFVVPFLLKNYASHFTQQPEKWMDKLKSLFGKNKNGKAHHEEAGMDAV